MESKKINQLATEMLPAATDLTIIGDPITGVSKKVTLEQISSLFSGLISFYANYAAFPATGEIDTIYCAKDTSKLYLWSGSAYVEVFPSQALLNTYQLRSEKGASNGYASLDSLGKVPIAQLPSSLMEYKGTWNASTNTPTLANGTGDTGDVYICSVAGTVNFGAGAITFAVGDYVIYSGTIWQRSSGATGTVTSVGITETGDALSITGSPITTSGTINIGFAGSAAQYVAGDGSLVTFPTLLSSDSLVKLVRNQSGATMTAGTVVYISGATGNKPLISKALATGDATSAQTYGLLQTDIANNADGYVVVIGNVTSLDTSALTEGQQLYLSGTTAGTYTTTKPYAPIHLVYVGIVLRAHPTMGIIGVKIQNGYEMDELHNVDAYLPNNNDILSYNTTTSLWEHKQIATTLGYTPANDSLVVHLAGSETITGLKTFNTPIALDNALNLKFDASINAFGGYYSLYAIKGVSSGNSILALYDGDTNKKSSLTFDNANNFNYLFPSTSGTVALTSDLTGGTVTSVAALTLGTTGTDLSSTVANGTTTPVITLNVPTASATNRGALSSADWTTFNNKQSTLSLTTTGNSGSATLVSNTLNVPTYTLAGLGGISLTSLSATTPLSYNNTTGAFSIQVANTSQDGYLSSTDWNTFNGKQNTITNPVTGTGTSGQVTYFNGTSSVTGSSSFKFDGTNLTIGNPSSALAQLHIYNASAAASFLLQTNSTTDYSEIAVRNNSSTATSYFRQYSTAATGSDFGISRAGLALFFSNYATNFAIGTRNGGDLILGTADTERARILASNGYVGINTSSPSYLLDVNSLTDTYTQFRTSAADADVLLGFSNTGDGNNGWGIGRRNTGEFWIANYTGNFLSGTRTIPFQLASTGAATFSSSVTAGVITSSVASGTGTLKVNNSSVSKAWSFYPTTNGSQTDITLYEEGTALNIMTFKSGGNVGIGTSSPSALLHLSQSTTNLNLYLQNTSGSGKTWAVNSDNLGSFNIHDTTANRLTITSGGTLDVKANSNNVNGMSAIISRLGSNCDNTSSYGLIVETGGNNRCFIYGNGNIVNTNNSYGAISDIKLKENIVDTKPKLDDLLKVKIRNYNLIGNETKQIGVIAQELEEIFPSMIDETEDFEDIEVIDEDGNTKKEKKSLGTVTKSVKYSVFVPMLVKAIQEQQAQIEELKLKIK
jgi:hypothetical protein